MPLSSIIRSDEDFRLGIWEIAEDREWLYDNISLTEEEENYYHQFRVDNRRRQWLAYRHLAQSMLGKDKTTILYDASGRPFVKDQDIYISVAHSGDLAVFMMSPNMKVGVDIEKISEKIGRVKDRFLCNSELEFAAGKKEMQYLCLLWCAKEALYKIYGEKNLDFKSHILIDPFILEDEGTFLGRIIDQQQEQEFMLHYLGLKSYYIAYVKAGTL